MILWNSPSHIYNYIDNIDIHSTSLICHRLLNFFKGEDRKVGNAQWIGGGMWLCQCVFRSGECSGFSFILSSWSRWLTYPQVKCKMFRMIHGRYFIWELWLRGKGQRKIIKGESQRDQQGLRIDRINWSTCYLSTGVAESEIVGFELGLSQTLVSTGPQVVCGAFFWRIASHPIFGLKNMFDSYPTSVSKLKALPLARFSAQGPRLEEHPTY